MNFSVGTEFASFALFKEALKQYEKSNWINLYHYRTDKLKDDIPEEIREVFVINSLRLRCKFGGPVRKSRSRNIRKTRSYKCGCPCRINVHYNEKKQVLHVTKYISDHNHTLSEDIFKTLPKQRRLSDENKKYVEKMFHVKGKAKLIQAQVNSLTNQKTLLRDIHNQKLKIKAKNAASMFDEEIIQFVNGLKESRETCVEMYNESELHGVYFQDERMKKYYNAYPELLVIDATYGSKNRKMPLFALKIFDGNGESQIVCLFITRTPNYGTMMKLCHKFKNENIRTDKLSLLIIDKNFTETKAVSDSFPGVQWQLCILYVLQIFCREMTTAKRGISVSQKNDVVRILRNMMISETEAMYFRFYEELRRLQLDSVLEYFDAHWHSVRYEWSACYVKKYYHYSVTTVNDVELLNFKLKSVVTKYTSLQSFFKETVQFMTSAITEKDYRTISFVTRQPINQGNEPEFVRQYKLLLTEFAFMQLKSQIIPHTHIQFTHLTSEIGIIARQTNNNLDNEVIYLTRMNACDCSYFLVMDLPCRHMLAFWQQHQLPKYAPHLCAARWLKSNVPIGISESVLSSGNKIETDLATTSTKIRKVSEITNKIVDALLQKPPLLFEIYIKSLKLYGSYVENNDVFSIRSSGIVSIS